jgi:hypothetical protein
MQYFWAVFLSSIFLMVLAGIISSKKEDWKIRKATREIFPEVMDHIQANRRYNIILDHDKSLENVRFIGISSGYDRHNAYLPFPLHQWLIVEMVDGKRAYLKPDTIKYYEDAVVHKEGA